MTAASPAFRPCSPRAPPRPSHTRLLPRLTSVISIVVLPFLLLQHIRAIPAPPPYALCPALIAMAWHPSFSCVDRIPNIRGHARVVSPHTSADDDYVNPDLFPSRRAQLPRRTIRNAGIDFNTMRGSSSPPCASGSP
ncbi:hypothetical protein B0H19DRAFT_1265196 [Mycena capillaripes]|nr:hypothetical protein B0H19DRAFT_1265196 [Mycena capillaripes]